MASSSSSLKATVDAVYPISPQAFQQLESLFEEQSWTEKEVFIRKDHPEQYEYFILQGICRSYVLSPEGEEITIHFFEGPAVLSPHITRTHEGISLLNFQALTDLSAVRFDAEAFVQLMIENLEVRFFANTVLQHELIQKVNKEIGLASLTARERLLQFRKDFQGLENKVPHPLIASYLGITPISLSRLRSELARG
jgi:CRP-like cAMP-binding protein